MTDEKTNSLLRLYSIGVAVKDKEKFSDELEIFLSEQMPYATGKILDSDVEHKKDVSDSGGNVTSVSYTSGYTITAIWLPSGSGNQITAPDVYKNESVKVYRYGDSNKYYWASLYREPKVRKQETVANMYSNETKFDKEYNKDSSYWTQVDTRDKKWQLHTSNNDGEKAKFDGILDTKNGVFTFSDGLGNSFKLESTSAKWTIKNNSGNTMTMNKGNTSLSVPSSYSLDSSNTTLSSKANTSMTSGGSFGIVAGGGFSLYTYGQSKCSAIGEFQIAGNPIRLIGDVIITKSLTVQGKSTLNNVTCGALTHKCCNCHAGYNHMDIVNYQT